MFQDFGHVHVRRKLRLRQASARDSGNKIWFCWVWVHCYKTL